ncbi:AMP-binding protein [Elstera sp.]|jgi:fatty-acyl-CoA synthase|uniref:AMP-binding protein n=1 Tax=Elstera sp. TaxID=1916664 RepID=UPI0037BF992F
MVGAVDAIGLHARLRPDAIAAEDLTRGQSWTYAALNRAVGQWAAALTAQGIRAGDRVAALAKNDAWLPILHHACARLGALYVPLNWRLSATEITSLLEDCRPALLVGDGLLTTLAASHGGIPLAVLAAQADGLAPLAEEPFDRALPSLILYTSGTSGRPKGVLLSEKNIDQTAISFSVLGEVTQRSSFLCDAPMFHIIGLITSLRPALLRGGRLIVSDGFIPARTLARLSDPELGITHYFCVPQMAALLRAEPAFDPERLRHLVAIFTGGAPHPAPAIQAWLDVGIPIVDGFGMSEAGTVFGMPVDRDIIAGRAGAAGIAMPGLQTRIIGVSGDDCGPGEAGELLLKGENITAGYWQRPDETAHAFTDDGWFRTGDIARADAEGFHWLVDRKKDMFISGGENIFPAEVEAAAIAHPDIAECAVVGLPDARWGEVGHLSVVLKAGSKLSAEGLLAFLETRIARFKLPKTILFVPALPRNGAGKLIKAEIKRQLSER